MILVGDCLTEMQKLETGCVQLTVTSPPYEDCRTYGMGFNHAGQDWVDWMIPRVVEMCRVTDGLVFVNAAGKVRDFKYSPVVEWLVADLTRHHGIVCGPAPYVFHRVGIPGSGGKHYHRRDWEPIYAFARPECLPPKWSDNLAGASPCRFKVGGQMSYRNVDGQRKNASAGPVAHERWGTKVQTRRKANGERARDGLYKEPKLANPGNVIYVPVGGGMMGSDLSHKNEAPFPEELVRRFIAWFCHPGGTVLDCFAGSGTVAAVAKQEGRKFIAIDVRESQAELIRARTRQEMLI